jgi:hypothetical protein
MHCTALGAPPLAHRFTGGRPFLGRVMWQRPLAARAGTPPIGGLRGAAAGPNGPAGVPLAQGLGRGPARAARGQLRAIGRAGGAERGGDRAVIGLHKR